MEKPVIILGGGYLGTLLALRLKDMKPEVPFVLYEESSFLGGERAETFFDPSPSSWVRPFLTQSWGEFRLGNEKSAFIPGHWHYVDGHFFHHYARSVLGKYVELNKMPTPESAIRESRFVIDTRNNAHFTQTYFQSEFSTEIVLANDHGLSGPLIASTPQETSRPITIWSIYPMGPRRVLIKYYWTFDYLGPELHEVKTLMLTDLHQRGCRIYRVLKEAHQILELPMTHPVNRTEGKVISLSGFHHGPRGSSIPQMIELVEKMTSGSFRYGELRQVVNEARQKFESRSAPYLSLNRLAEGGAMNALYEWLGRQHPGLIERYFAMKLSGLDKFRLKLWATIWKLNSKKSFWDKKPRYQCQFSK